ncbi:MAG: tetratricopeptide repeat protein [Chloroflexota bacterium]
MDFDDLWDYNDPEATERKLRGLLPSAAGDASYHAQLLTQIARAQGLQRKFDEAHRTLDEAQSLLTDDLAQARIRYLLERGRVFNSSKHREQARPLFLEAWELATSAGEDSYAIDAAHMLGIVEQPEQALEWNLKALVLAETTPDERAQNWRGSLYNNIGWTYHDAGNYQKAFDLFERALRWREAQGRLPQIRIAKWCVARALRSLGRLEEALAAQQALLAEHENAGGKDGYVYEELGECLLALNRQEEARPYFALAYDELSKDPWLADNEPARLERLKQLGRK